MERGRVVSVCVVALGVLFISTPLFAKQYQIQGKDVAIEGFVRQEFGFNVNHNSSEKTNQTGLQSAYQMWYLDINSWLTRSLEVRSIFRLWGDMVYAIRGRESHFGRYFYPSKHYLQWDDGADEIVRELYLSYSTPRFFVRAGKQQVAWGEADGLRLLDIINPLDVRRDFQFYDTEGFEEVRIPKWMIKAEYYPGNLGALYDVGVELIWNPGDIQETKDLMPSLIDAQYAEGKFVPGVYPTAIPNKWGTWGPPTPYNSIPVRLHRKKRATSLANSEFGGRLKFIISNATFTLNYWHGFNPNDVVAYQGILPDSGGMMVPGGPPVPLAAVFDREYDRINIIGASMSKELSLGRWLRMATNPVLRIEALYSIDQKFNTREVVFGPGGPAAAPEDVFKRTDKDQLRYMIGFDWPVRIQFINPNKNVFFSGQFFHIHTFNYDGGEKAILQLAPYDWRLPQNQFYLTLLVRTEYKNEQIVPSVLTAADCHTGAMWGKAKVLFRIGNHWRPEIGYLWITRNRDHHAVHEVPGQGPVTFSDDYKSFGIFHDRDQVFIRIQYQF